MRQARVLNMASRCSYLNDLRHNQAFRDRARVEPAGNQRPILFLHQSSSHVVSLGYEAVMEQVHTESS